MSAVPVCSLRDTIAFLRDPAAFTAGPGSRLGDFYRVRLPGHRLHVVTDPDLIERILITDASRFVKSHFYWRELGRTLGDSMGSLEGPRWEYLHRAQRPYFTPDAVVRYLPAVETQVTIGLQRLADGLEAEPHVPLLELLAELNARIVLCVLFGRDEEPAALELARRIADGHAIVAWRDKFPWRPALGWLNGVNHRAARHKHALSRYAAGLATSSAGGDPRRLLHALLHLDEDPNAPDAAISVLRNEVTFHLGASTETQAAAVGWTLYLLSKHPLVLQRLREEIACASSAAPASSPDVAALTYAQQVIREALRLYPPVHAIVRDCVEPTQLRGYATRRGETFLISVLALHRHPRLWEDPEQFRPERFDTERAAALGRHVYLPFGAGRHVCIGQHLALPAMVLTLAQFVQRFDWSFVDTAIRPEARPSLKPSGSFVARLTRRDWDPRASAHA